MPGEDDKIARRQWKAAITRHIGTLEMLMAEEDHKGLEERLEQLKNAFRSFEESHDKFHPSLQEEADQDESDRYFLDVQSNYTAAVRSAKANLKALPMHNAMVPSVDEANNETSSLTGGDSATIKPEGIQPLASDGDSTGPRRSSEASAHIEPSDLFSLMSLSKSEVDEKFYGDPARYHCFIALFEECVKVVKDDKIKLTKLLQSTTGKAHNSIKPCVLMADGYERARQILRERYGDDHLVMERIINNLRRGNPVKTAEELMDFADEINNCFRTLSSMERVQEIDNQVAICEMMGRLQPYIQHRWRRQVMNTKRTTGKYPSFEDFSKFVHQEAQEASDPIYGRSSRTSNGASRSSKASSSATTFSSDVTNQRNVFKRVCVLCKGEHKLFGCYDFKTMKPFERLQVVNKHKLCHNCLLSNHSTQDCRKPSTCSVPGCNKRHTKFIHIVSRSDDQKGNVYANDQVVRMTNASTTVNKNIHMPVVAATVNGQIDVCVLLDSASTNTFCSRSLVESLGVQKHDISYSLNTLSGEENVESCAVDLVLTSVDGGECLQLLSVYVVDNIPVMTPSVEVQGHDHLRGISLVEGGQRVQLLLGQDNSEALIPLEIRKGNKGDPFASRTLFGWSLNGPEAVSGVASKRVLSHFVKSETLDEKIDRLWGFECDEILSDDLALSQEDKKVLGLWEQEVKFKDGHIELPIPWKENILVPNNYVVAASRLKSLTVTLGKKGLLERYNDEMRKLLCKGYAEKVPDGDVDISDGVWFLPHQAVINDKKPDKLRIVFDCAAKYRGQSLNDKCLQGPDLNNKLLHVLLRFRQHQYALMADVESMYYQVRIPVHERNVLRFLWYDANDKVTQYRMTCHVFGGIWCASSSTFAMRYILNGVDVDPIVADAIQRSFYVDDCLRSTESRDEALRVIQGAKQVLSDGGFNLTGFVANDLEVLSEIPEEHRAKEVKDLNPCSSSKALGVKWDVQDDVFFVDVCVEDIQVLTKRKMLSIVASLYDPIGIVSPLIVTGKILLQKAMKCCSWDEPVPTEIGNKWNSWILALRQVADLKIPRCVKPSAFNDAVIELHNFSDASEKAYGSCCYVRCVNKDGEIHAALLHSRCRVAPQKATTIPRLELQAAVLSAKLDTMIREELDLHFTESYFWTDSEIVLKYISNESRRFAVFVANRVSIIRQLTNPSQWHHIAGSDNPADLLTRGQTLQSMDVNLWLEGPQFLKMYKSDWKFNSCDPYLPDGHPELKKTSNPQSITSLASSVDGDPIAKLFEHYSDWSKLLRAIAWILRLRQTLRKVTVPNHKQLSVSELHDAEIAVVKYVQSQCFSKEISMLSQNGIVGFASSIKDLSPYLDEHSLLRVGGRLRHAEMTKDSKQPYVLPHSHRISNLIASHYHNIAHLGTEWVVSNIRERFWITRIRSVVKKASSQCFKCKRRFASTCSQKMADLPSERVECGRPAFAYVGVDVFGTFYVKRGRSEIKRYGCIFTCLSTRAIHIEKLDSMETDSFLNGFRRFTSRRGVPERVFSDQGTNFVGGKSELDRSMRQLDSPRIQRFFTSKKIEWVFNPPGASHMGGTWERMIRTIRKVLVGILQTPNRLTDESLETLLCEVEFIVNGRPITKVSDSVDDFAPLTPNHLLLLREMPSLPPGIFEESDLYRRRWRAVQHLADTFWRRWMKEYIPELQRRCKWLKIKNNVSVGDLVLLREENTPRGVWPMGLVVETFDGRDGLVRSVKIRTKSTYLTRPITKVVILEGSQ